MATVSTVGQGTTASMKTIQSSLLPTWSMREKSISYLCLMSMATSTTVRYSVQRQHGKLVRAEVGERTLETIHTPE